MRVFKDGFETVRPVEKVVVAEKSLFGGCPERLTIELPQLEPGERLVCRGSVVFIRSRKIPG